MSSGGLVIWLLQTTKTLPPNWWIKSENVLIALSAGPIGVRGLAQYRSLLNVLRLKSQFSCLQVLGLGRQLLSKSVPRLTTRALPLEKHFSLVLL